jgi:hypothetical protein
VREEATRLGKRVQLELGGHNRSSCWPTRSSTPPESQLEGILDAIERGRSEGGR